MDVAVELAGGTRTVSGFPDRFADHQAATVRGTAPYVVVLSNGVSKAVAMRVARACGANVVGPLPPRAFLVEASALTLGRLSQDPHFVAATELLPSDKVAPGFAAGRATVVALAEGDVEGLAEFIRGKGCGLEPTGPRGKTSLVARLTPELVGELARRGEVRWIEPRPEMKLLNDYASADTGVVATRNALGLTGAGQVIASADSGLDTGDVATLHHDFTNRVLSLVNLGGRGTVDYSGHGTHTAGTLAGSGVMSDGQYEGVAPGARLFIQCCGDSYDSPYIYFDNAETYDDIFAAGLPSGACIHSDSWGGVYEDEDKKKHYGYYDDFCCGLDDVVWRHPELLVVVANGNDGSGRMTVGIPASAKNCLAVGNARSSRGGGNPQNIVNSSSRGPCADGRIKPEIAAPGSSIVSTRSTRSSCTSFGGNSSYTQMSGTSMATPHVAGCAALVRQWLVEQQGFTNALPTAALLKAILTGGAFSASLLPDTACGWGLVDLDETLAPSNRTVHLVDRVPYAEGTQAVYGFALTNDAPFEVQLAWLDYPATFGAASALVNNLDLVVSNRTTGAVWYGNGVEGGDRTNTVESVRVAAMPAGEYDIRVVGRDVFYPSTLGGAAALYVRGAFRSEDEFWSEDEPESVGIVYVDASAGDDATADGTGAAPYASISAALSAVKDGDTVLVAPGTYAAVSVPCGLAVEIVSARGASSAIIDGRGVTSCYDDARSKKSVLRGFTLVNGYSTSKGGGTCGGTLVNCVISNCTAKSGGGAFASDLIGCLVASNRAVSTTAQWAYGGGAHNCNLYNCTVVGNVVRATAVACGGGAYAGGWLDAGGWYGSAYNTVFFGNEAEGDEGGYGPDYCDDTLWTAKCLIGEDPHFVDAEHGDYRIRADSPCVDAGYDEMVFEASDLAGNVRVQGSAVDVGCYEYEQKVAFGRRTLWCSAAAQTKGLDVFADGNWSISSDSAWVSVNGVSGTSATCEIGENETGVSRTARVTLRGNGGDASAVLEVRQVAAPAQKGGTRYGLFVGVNEYDENYVGSDNWLGGCVPDALSLRNRSVQSRLLKTENTTVLTNALATKAAIRATLADLAGRAVPGDVVVYAHSSHGWSDSDCPKEAGLCAYDGDYDEEELAQDLLRFADGVRVVVIVDACRSGGLFKSPGGLSSVSASFARGTLRAMRARRTSGMGLLAKNPGEADYDENGDVAFVTAADYDQYSWDEGSGGAFTGALVEGWSTGEAEADGDGRLDFRELYDYAAVRAVGYRDSYPEDWTEAQCFNEPLLLTTLAELTDAQWADPGIEADDTPEAVADKVQTALVEQGVSAEKASAVTSGEQYDALVWWLEAMGIPVASFNASPSALVSAALCADALLTLEEGDVKVADLVTSDAGLKMVLGLDAYNPARVSPALLRAAVGVVGSETPGGTYSSQDLDVTVQPTDAGVELTVTPPSGRDAYFLKGTVR